MKGPRRVTSTRSFYVALVLSLLLAALSGATQARASGGLIYVDANAGGADNGTSWSDAYVHLQDALDLANANPSADYEIWVAAGVYHPDEDSSGNRTDGDPSQSFVIAHDNVEMYGGFAGWEKSRVERDWETNVTVLSGDIDGNDATDGHGVTDDWRDIAGSNAHTVVFLNAIHHGSITNATVVDGFTVTGGAKGLQREALSSSYEDIGGGICCLGDPTHGWGCAPTLRNLQVIGNQAEATNTGSESGAGGGIYIGLLGSDQANTQLTVSSPTVSNVELIRNRAYSGGGMAVQLDDCRTGGQELYIALEDVLFMENEAYWGAGLFLHGYQREEDDGYPELVIDADMLDVRFVRNVQDRTYGFDGTGSGIWVYAMGNVRQDVTMTNGQFIDNQCDGGKNYHYCEAYSEKAYESYGAEIVTNLRNTLFNGNLAVTGVGSAIALDGGAAELHNLVIVNHDWVMYQIAGQDPVTMTNSIVWANGGNTKNCYPGSNFKLSYTDWQGGAPSCLSAPDNDLTGVLDADPQFADAGGPDGVPGTADDDLRIGSGSPVLDAGDNTAVPVDVAVDLDGQARFADAFSAEDTGQGTPPIVDLGPYERHETPPPIIGELDPPAVTIGESVTLTVSGSNFTTDSIIRWNGEPLTTTFVSQSELEAWIAEARTADSGQAAITVRDAGTGETSDVVYLPISYEASLMVEPPLAILRTDDALTIDVLLTTDEMYGVEFDLAFDPSVITVTSVHEGFAWTGRDYTVIEKDVDNVEGLVSFAAYLQRPGHPMSRERAKIATLELAAVAAGKTSLELQNALVSNIDGQALVPLQIQDGELVVQGMSCLSGVVELQGRPGASDGASIELAGGQAGPYVVESDADGSWTICDVIEDTYRLTVSMPGYLSAERSNLAFGQGGETLTPVRLLAGDCDGNEVVDIFDAATLGAAFDSSPPLDVRADLNADGIVNVQDASLLGGNWQVTGPLTW